MQSRIACLRRPNLSVRGNGEKAPGAVRQTPRSKIWPQRPALQNPMAEPAGPLRQGPILPTDCQQ